jgi:hypothetical protein
MLPCEETETSRTVADHARHSSVGLQSDSVNVAEVQNVADSGQCLSFHPSNASCHIPQSTTLGSRAPESEQSGGKTKAGQIKLKLVGVVDLHIQIFPIFYQVIAVATFDAAHLPS